MAKQQSQATTTKGPAPTEEAGQAGTGAVAEVKAGGALALLNFEADAGAGLEGADKDSFAVPFLVMLQGLSPQVQEGLVEGAKAGMMINTITNEMSTSIDVVPCAFKRTFLRWTPRDEGGGFKGEYSPAIVEGFIKDGLAKEVIDEKGGRHLMYDGDELKDTRVHYVLMLTDNGPKPIILSMSSTQIKHSRKWLTRIGDIKLPRANGEKYTPASYSHVYKLRSVKESNNKGTWYGFDINIVGPVTEPAVYEHAKKFHEQFVKGSVKANFEQTGGAADDGGTGDKF